MLNFQDIVSQYPAHLQGYKKNILREYLQYKILEAIYNSSYANKLFFLGGTALRIIHGNTRFSEDLDFDNNNLTEIDFNQIITIVTKSLEGEGLQVETRNVHKGVYRCYMKFPSLMYQLGLTPQKREKILIQLDTISHPFSYQHEQVILNKFDVFTQINVTPIDILLAQKFHTMFERKRPKGRDYYDIVFLLSKTKPSYQYLEEMMGVTDGAKLKKKVLAFVKSVDLKQLANEVQPFLHSAKDINKVLLFTEYIKEVEL